MNKNFIFLVSILALNIVKAEHINLRYTLSDQLEPKLETIIERVATDSNLPITANDFIQIENTQLTNYKYLMLAQNINGVPVANTALRIWINENNNEQKVVQVEVDLEKNAFVNKSILTSKYNKALFSNKALSSKKLENHVIEIVKSLIKNHPDDNQIFGFKSRDLWVKNDLVREIKVKGRRGEHTILFSLFSNKIIKESYNEFPQADQTISLKAKVYPIYEQVETTGQMLTREDALLKHIKKNRLFSEADPYAPLKTKRYLYSMYNPILAETEAGRSQGYWSSANLKRQAYEIQRNLPIVENTTNTTDGLILDGLYTSINIHPKALDVFTGINFKLKPSIQFKPDWKETEDGDYEFIPQASLLGKPIFDLNEVYERTATRAQDHNPVFYMNEGFDEVQVYYAVTTFMESLRNMGFLDPELSTRPFHAFLYDPDINMKDNAYYTDDTINFTTYSPESINYARDNSTIWHELGHGIMDRVMGDYLQLADTGGLSEGMADFLAALVIEDVSSGNEFPGSRDFRILNNTGFNLTNEVHDDGEAYGGAMKDMLEKAISQYGKLGLVMITDLTLEAMRLSRNNPALTAQDWFNHMLYADELGSSKRNPGELRYIIINALNGRNFSFDGTNLAKLNIKYNDSELTNSSPGSRENPIRLNLNADEQVSYDMKLNLVGSTVYKFKYPVTVKVEYKKGALQGAINWVGEDQNPMTYTLNSEDELLNFKIAANGKCDYTNQESGGCKDYAYIQIFNANDLKKPSAKKRFYLKISPKE